MTVRRITCPARCGSSTFSAVRRGALVEDFTVRDDGTPVTTSTMAEGGGPLTLRCECGRTWRTSRDLDLALFVEGR
jgi:hypothetical protein